MRIDEPVQKIRACELICSVPLTLRRGPHMLQPPQVRITIP